MPPDVGGVAACYIITKRHRGTTKSYRLGIESVDKLGIHIFKKLCMTGVVDKRRVELGLRYTIFAQDVGTKGAQGDRVARALHRAVADAICKMIVVENVCHLVGLEIFARNTRLATHKRQYGKRNDNKRFADVGIPTVCFHLIYFFHASDILSRSLRKKSSNNTTPTLIHESAKLNTGEKKTKSSPPHTGTQSGHCVCIIGK